MIRRLEEALAKVSTLEAKKEAAESKANSIAISLAASEASLLGHRGEVTRLKAANETLDLQLKGTHTQVQDGLNKIMSLQIECQRITSEGVTIQERLKAQLNQALKTAEQLGKQVYSLEREVERLSKVERDVVNVVPTSTSVTTSSNTSAGSHHHSDRQGEILTAVLDHHNLTNSHFGQEQLKNTLNIKLGEIASLQERIKILEEAKETLTIELVRVSDKYSVCMAIMHRDHACITVVICYYEGC